MASEVYGSTTSPNPKSSWFIGPSEVLFKARFVVKILEVLLSFVAFILEEVVNSCVRCSALYLFEFVSCTAFLFTLLLLILLSTTLHTRVGITCWPHLDFVYTAVIGLVFLIASIAFASDNSNTTMERSAVVFGFLATVLFFVDVGLFVKDHGIPFKKDGKSQSSNGVPAAGGAGPAENAEVEKLNPPANGQAE